MTWNRRKSQDPWQSAAVCERNYFYDSASPEDILTIASNVVKILNVFWMVNK